MFLLGFVGIYTLALLYCDRYTVIIYFHSILAPVCQEKNDFAHLQTVNGRFKPCPPLLSFGTRYNQTKKDAMRIFTMSK